MTVYKDQTYCGSDVEVHTCGREFTEQDAINAEKWWGGNAHRKSITTKSIGDWLYVNDYPDGFQVLCHNCNMAKGIYGKCPHKTI